MDRSKEFKNNIKTVEACNHTNRNKSAKTFINLNMPKLQKDFAFRVIGLTGIFTPDMNVNNAWKQVIERLYRSVELLTQESDVFFVLSCLEVHPGSNKSNKEGSTLEGYPHIHMMIAYNSYTGTFRDTIEFGRLIQDQFPDIQVGGRKTQGRNIDYEDPLKLTAYIIKNARHKTVIDKLGGNECIMLWNHRKTNDVDDFFRGLIKFNVPILFVYQHITKEAPEPSKLTIKKGTSRFQKALNFIKAVMELNDLRISEGYIFKKIEGSRMSWKYEMSFDNIIGCCMDTSDHSDLMVKEKSNLIRHMESEDQNYLPTLKLDYQWLEYKDFYYFIPTGTILNCDQTKYNCFNYFPEISLKDFQNGDIEPKEWLSILRNSNRNNLDIYKTFYSLFMLRGHKEKVPYLVGPPNCGKTTLIDPIRDIYPVQKIAIIVNAGHFTNSMLVDKTIAIFDEGAGMKTLDEATLLKVLENKSLIGINEKFKNPKVEEININIVIMSNENDLTRDLIAFDKNNPLVARINPIILKTLDKPDSKKHDLVMKEQGKIVLYLGVMYFDRLEIIDNPDNPLIVNWMENNKKIYSKNHKNITVPNL